MKVNNFWLLLVITISLILLAFIYNYYLDSRELLYNFYSNQLTKEQIEKLIAKQKEWAWIGYISIPAMILLRSNLVAICLTIGAFFYDMERKTPFKHFFRIALIGEFVLIFVGLVKLLYFLFVKTDYTLQDLQQYYPLSYINFLDIEKLQPWLIYPLQTINLFELAYFLVLVYGLNKLLKNKYWKSFEITVVSYGTGLVIWIGLVMFLTLNIS